MSNRNKKNYVVYSLSRLDLCYRNVPGTISVGIKGKVEFGWVPRYYTVDSLAHTIAFQLVNYGKSEILDNSVECISNIIPASTCKKVDYGFLGVRYVTHYETKYFIAKKCGASDEEIRAVEISTLKDIIQKYVERITERKNKYNKKISYERKSSAFKFRDGSVPRVGHCRWHRGSYYRIPRLGSARRLNNGTDAEEFESVKYRVKNLPVWDDRLRHMDKSWKTSHKVRKQWMKHLNKHVYTEHVECNDCEEYEEYYE